MVPEPRYPSKRGVDFGRGCSILGPETHISRVFTSTSQEHGLMLLGLFQLPKTFSKSLGTCHRTLHYPPHTAIEAVAAFMTPYYFCQLLGLIRGGQDAKGFKDRVCSLQMKWSRVFLCLSASLHRTWISNPSKPRGPTGFHSRTKRRHGWASVLAYLKRLNSRRGALHSQTAQQTGTDTAESEMQKTSLQSQIWPLNGPLSLCPFNSQYGFI